MRDTLADIVKQTIGVADILKVTGSLSETRLQAVDDKKTLFLEGHLTDAIPEFQGEFGITNLSLLRGLLDFTSYRTDNATFTVKRRPWNGVETVEQFEFRDGKGAGADFRCMSPERVPDQADIRSIPWDIDITPNKGKITEFQLLSSLYAEVDKDKLFGVKVEGGNLLFILGTDNSSTHRASMVFEENVTGTINAGLQFSATQFLQILKIAGNDARVRLTSRGILCVEATTQFGLYRYYLRAHR